MTDDTLMQQLQKEYDDVTFNIGHHHEEYFKLIGRMMTLQKEMQELKNKMEREKKNA